MATTAAAPQETGDDVLAQEAAALAERLLVEGRRAAPARERRSSARIARLLEDPGGLAFVTALTDEVLRTRPAGRAAAQLRDLVAGAQGWLGPVDRLLLRVGVAASSVAPGVVVPLVRARVRRELAGFVVDAEDPRFARHLARRRRAGVATNVNLLGEAVLGDAEAARRRRAAVALLRRPDVSYVSVKVSSVCAGLQAHALDHEVGRVVEALRPLYLEAAAHRPAKLVNLDMEEYRDLALTVAAARRLLAEPALAGLDAGIVLQAYLPDSLAALEELAAFARERHAAGGGALKVRIVKGANLAMEEVTAELAGWAPAPFATKAETDAQYKRMLDVALDPANLGALRVGVASHNLFEQAWALVVARARGVEAMVEPEVLEGMAPSLAAAIHAEAGRLLVYVPVAPRADDESVTAYLVRRFEENTGPDNFLRHQFALAPGSAAWLAERARFEAAVADRHRPVAATRRTQDRAAEAAGEGQGVPRPGGPWVGEPDTDPAAPANRAWLAARLGAPAALPDLIPAVVAGEEVTGPDLVDGHDPATPDVPAYRWVAATTADVRRAVAAAGPAGAAWRARPAAERAALLAAAGDALAADRAGLLDAMATDTGKTLPEADPEVSEAVDFARWYARSVTGLERPDARFHPHRTVAVVPPWNFPLAIPAGGVLAALAAGAAVLLKPAPEAVAVGWRLVQALWAAGLPRDLVQWVPCADGEAGRALVTDPAVDAVVLTGSWATARMFLGWRPDLALHAETSGKGALVVTATADLDAAVADIVRSAFGHAGQKCSAASLAIVEAPLHDDPRFTRQLEDAVRSLRVGPAWDPATTMGPLIRPPEGPLADALTRLEPGERWLVEPRRLGPCLWTPGVKLGVAPGSPFHLTECFGPVLGVMRARDLDEAIAWQDGTGFGLTAGLHSLDPAEIARWRDRVHAGNLYVNRHTTGAIVGRQPFGGWRRSVVGPGAKAGGPAYVASLGHWEAIGADPPGAEAIGADPPGAEAIGPDPAAFKAAVGAALAGPLAPVDLAGLAAEADVLRHVPLERVLLRVGPGAGDAEVALALAAARAAGVAVEVSLAADEPDDAVATRAVGAGADSVRLLGGADPALRLAVLDAGIGWDATPVVAVADLEARRWVREQALSETRHRHGDPDRRRPGPLG